jgi:hypothetical protein
LKAFLPRILLPVALFPLPVRPTKTIVRTPFDGEANSQSSSIALPPIVPDQITYNISYFKHTFGREFHLYNLKVTMQLIIHGFHMVKTNFLRLNIKQTF